MQSEFGLDVLGWVELESPKLQSTTFSMIEIG